MQSAPTIDATDRTTRGSVARDVKASGAPRQFRREKCRVKVHTLLTVAVLIAFLSACGGSKRDITGEWVNVDVENVSLRITSDATRVTSGPKVLTYKYSIRSSGSGQFIAPLDDGPGGKVHAFIALEGNNLNVMSGGAASRQSRTRGVSGTGSAVTSAHLAPLIIVSRTPLLITLPSAPSNCMWYSPSGSNTFQACIGGPRTTNVAAADRELRAIDAGFNKERQS
jgi:hypothetical protein